MLITIAVFVLAHYAAFFGLAALSYVAGRALARRQYDSIAERWAFCASLGLGAIAYATFLAGLLHLLYPAVLLGVLAVASIAYPPAWREMSSDLSRVVFAILAPRARMRVAFLIVLLMVPLLILPLYPPTPSDATSYHLAAAKIYSQSHWLQPTTYLRFPVFPQMNEMLFALMISIYDGVSAQFVQFLMMVLVAVALYAWGSGAFSTRAGAWATALWLGNPLVLWLGASGYIDVGLTLFITMAVYAFWLWQRSQERSWCVLAAVFFGFALGSKYSALFFMGLLSVIMVYHSIITRRLASFFLFAGIASAIALPWYFRNYYYTGNPVFPFFPEVFGYSLWTKREVQAQLFDLLHAYGLPHTVASVFLLPWDFIFHQRIFHVEARVSPIYALAIPLLFIPGHRSGLGNYLLGLSLCYTVFWFFYGQILRYWLPVIPLLSLAISRILDDLVNSRPNGAKALPASATALGILLFISPSLLGATKEAIGRGPVPVTREQSSLYFWRRVPTYRAYEYLNGLRGSNYRLYALYDEPMAFFANGLFMGDWFGPGRYENVASALGDSKALYQRLKALGATHFLVNFRREVPNVVLPEDQFFQSHFKMIYALANGRLFELVERPLIPAEGPELLRNPGFEDLRNHEPIGWNREGLPVVDETGQYSHCGLVAVLSKGFRNVLTQAVPIEPGHLYVLREFVRAAEPGSTARLQINWANEQGKFLGFDIRVVDVDVMWRRYEMPVTAPNRATTAIIYASSHAESVVWFDDLSLREIWYR